MGRKSKWETHIEPNIDRIPKMRHQGLTEEQIAHTLGVGYTTLKKYKNLKPALATALKEGKERLIENLEESLYIKAMGGFKKSKVIYKHMGDRKIPIKTEVEELAPDTGALIFALKNLDPVKWQDRRQVETTFNDDNKVVVINTLPRDDEE